MSKNSERTALEAAAAVYHELGVREEMGTSYAVTPWKDLAKADQNTYLASVKAILRAFKDNGGDLGGVR